VFDVYLVSSPEILLECCCKAQSIGMIKIELCTGLTIKHDIGYTLNKWMLISLSLKESTKHTLVVRKDLAKVSKDFRDETGENIWSDDWRRSIPERCNEDLKGLLAVAKNSCGGHIRLEQFPNPQRTPSQL